MPTGHSRWLVSARLLLAALLLALPALAEDTVARTDTTTSDPASNQSDTTSRAAAAYREAEVRYEAGDMDGARTLLEESYALSKRPELLYNLGQLERELGHCRPALEQYHLYLERMPNGSERERALSAVAELEAQCPDAPPAPPVTPAAAPISAPPRATEANPSTKPAGGWTSKRVLGWTAIGTGVVAGATSAYFFVASANANAEVDDLLAGAGTGSAGTWDTTGRPLEEKADRDRALGIGFAAGAAALVAGGVTLLLLDAADQRRARTRGVSVWVDDHTWFLDYEQAF